jgi:hypothetical protein
MMHDDFIRSDQVISCNSQGNSNIFISFKTARRTFLSIAIQRTITTIVERAENNSKGIAAVIIK